MTRSSIKANQLPAFKAWVSTLKAEIKSAQIKSACAVNRGLLELYWNLGAQITEKEKNAHRGDGFLKKLSDELMAEFKGMKGFSHRNLKYIKQWYLFYHIAFEKRQQLVAQLADCFYQIPWGHHLYIMSKCGGDVDKACFYIVKTCENHWSRSVLLNFLDTDLYQREGKALTNFSANLLEPQRDLAKQILKDPYNFDFLCMRENYMEKELEDALAGNITRFLLELGRGFAFIGRQEPLNVGSSTLYADLLFYNIELRCYMVIELKTTVFEPSFIGQLSTYVTAVNHVKRKESNNPTIGLLICKDKDNVVAQYTLEGSNLPLGISEYELSKLLPEDYKTTLPSIEDIEAELK